MSTNSSRLPPYVRAHAKARAWIELQHNLQRAPNTVAAYAQGLEDFLSFCSRSAVDADNAGRNIIANYVRDMADRPPAGGRSAVGLSNASRHLRLTAVRLFYDYLVEEEARSTNPVVRGIAGSERSILRHQRRLPWIPNEEQWRVLLAAARAEPLRNRLMLALAYDCALRREELCSIDTADIDPAHGTITIRAETTKTGSGRCVPYSVVTADSAGPLSRATARAQPGSGTALPICLYPKSCHANNYLDMVESGAWAGHQNRNPQSVDPQLSTSVSHRSRPFGLGNPRNCGIRRPPQRADDPYLHSPQCAGSLSEVHEGNGVCSCSANSIVAGNATMMFRGHAAAASNDLPFPLPCASFDTSPSFTVGEQAALARLIEAYATKGIIGDKSAHDALTRLTDPIEQVLDWIRTPAAAKSAAKRVMIAEMKRLDRPYWRWSASDCIDVACADAPAYKARHGFYGGYRQQMLALMCVLCGFDRLTEIGRFPSISSGDQGPGTSRRRQYYELCLCRVGTDRPQGPQQVRHRSGAPYCPSDPAQCPG